jgi:DnaJ-class molecular chaperone
MNGDRITPPGTFAPGGIRAAAATTSSARQHRLEVMMANEKGPNVKKKQKCKNCEGKGLLKKGDKVVKCQRCGGTGLR